MFKKKEKIDRYWEDEEYMKIHTLDIMNNLNESQKRFGIVNIREYVKQKGDISERIEDLERKWNIYEEKEAIFND